MTKHHFSIEVKSGDELTQVETEEIIDLCSRVYEEPYEPFLETFPNPTHVLGRLGDVLVSHALWITRWMQLRGKLKMKTAYVEAVATDKAQRGKGFASEVMTTLVAQIKDYDIGALSPADTALYHRLGWEYWSGPLYARKEGDWILVPEESAMIYRTANTPRLDIHAPLSIEWREGDIW